MRNDDKIEIASLSLSIDDGVASLDTVIVTDDWPDGSPSNQSAVKAELEETYTASDRSNAFIRQCSKRSSGLTDADEIELQVLLGTEDFEETKPGSSGEASRLNRIGFYATDRSTPVTTTPNDASPAPK